MNCSFKFQHYAEILDEAIRLGYEITSFKRYNEDAAKAIILRHDVDFTTDGIRDFAEIEHQAGVSATYFIRTHAREYNIFDHRNYLLFIDILNMGHELGFHFECIDFVELAGMSEELMFRKGKRVLEEIFDIEIISVSQHVDLCFYSHSNFHYFFEIHRKQDFSVINYALEPRFVKDMKYLSDSNSVWKEGCPCRQMRKYNKLQILTHADWWFESFYHLKGEVYHPR